MPTISWGTGPIWTSRPRYRNDGTRVLSNIWHEFLMQTYSDAAWDWKLRCDEVAFELDTETKDFKLEHPHPQLKDFMIRLGREWRYHQEESCA